MPIRPRQYESGAGVGDIALPEHYHFVRLRTRSTTGYWRKLSQIVDRLEEEQNKVYRTDRTGLKYWVRTDYARDRLFQGRQVMDRLKEKLRKFKTSLYSLEQVVPD